MSDLVDNAVIDNTTGEVSVVSPYMDQIKKQMAGLSPMHAMLWNTFVKAGGEEALQDYATENFGWFFKTMMGSLPNIQPVSGIQGEVKVKIHPSLGATVLDDESE